MLKRISLSTIGLILFGGTLFAQISIEKDSLTLENQDPSKFEIGIYFTVSNNSAIEDTSFYWRRVIQPNCDFTSAICDMNLCYPIETDSASFIMESGVDTLFVVYFYPENKSGCCSLWLYLVSKTNSTNIDSAFYQACTLASIFDLSQNPLSVYPNPSGNSIRINTSMPNSYGISIYNSSGVLVKNYSEVFDNSELDVSTLIPGLYYIKTIGEKVYSGSFQKL